MDRGGSFYFIPITDKSELLQRTKVIVPWPCDCIGSLVLTRLQGGKRVHLNSQNLCTLRLICSFKQPPRGAGKSVGSSAWGRAACTAMKCLTLGSNRVSLYPNKCLSDP